MQKVNQSPHHTFLRVYLYGGTLLLSVVALFNFIVDPLQFYRAAWYPPIFIQNQRFQNPGLAKNYNYDTVIIGTSHTENFSPNYIRTHLGWDTLKLSIKGSTAKEQALILQKALDTGQVKNIIWGIELSAFIGDPNRINEQDGTFPEYLYHETPLTHLTYLLSWDTTMLSLDALRGQGLHDLETLNMWYQKYTFDTNRVQEAWQASALKSEQMRQQTGPVLMEQTTETLQAHLVQIVAQNPNVKFFLFFPPTLFFHTFPIANVIIVWPI